MTAALLCIDMQYIHVHPDFSVSGRNEPDAHREYVRSRLHKTVLPGQRALQDRWRDRGALLVHIVFNHIAPDGSDLEPQIYRSFRAGNPDPRTWAIRTREDPLSAVLVEVAPRPGEILLEKTTYSAFASTNLDFVLKNHGIDSLVLVGGLTGCCVRHTAADGGKNGYRIYTVPDADIDRTPERHGEALRAVAYDGLLTLGEAAAFCA